jgi:hypothetical protein
VYAVMGGPLRTQQGAGGLRARCTDLLSVRRVAAFQQLIKAQRDPPHSATLDKPECGHIHPDSDLHVLVRLRPGHEDLADDCEGREVGVSVAPIHIEGNHAAGHSERHPTQARADTRPNQRDATRMSSNA